MTKYSVCTVRLTSRSLAIACLAGLPLIWSSAAQASPESKENTIVVTNCNDSGPGSLRDAVAKAASGDIVDLRQTGCGEITLAGQPIVINQDDLALLGPGPNRLILDGDYKSSVLRHFGAGTLDIVGLAIERGYEWKGRDEQGEANRIARGGCIFSEKGSVAISYSEVRHCWANGRVQSHGGGIYAGGNVEVEDSSVYLNKATTGLTPRSYGSGGGISTAKHASLLRSRVIQNTTDYYGGGVAADQGVQIIHSEISNNKAAGGGGAYIFGSAKITGSTISGNSASGSGYTQSGGIYIGLSQTSTGGPETASITNSTFSGNSSNNVPAMWVQRFGPGTFILKLSNNTFAYNKGGICQDQNEDNAAVEIKADAIELNSNIFSNSLCNENAFNDIHLTAADYEGEGGPQVTGSHNLIMNTPDSEHLPADTISSDPMLAPLADNGGIRKTHALQPGSPAIDAGANPLNLKWDQRWGYPRTKGSQTDIGAYEY